MWEMTAQGSEHQEAGITGGHLGGWLQQVVLLNMHEAFVTLASAKKNDVGELVVGR